MRFKTTKNIFVDFEEFFDQNWMNSNKLILPPNSHWDYKRPMKIEDVNVWEVIYEQGGAVGVYASWDPYAEFYMIRVGWLLEQQGYGVETYYGPKAMKEVTERMDEMDIPYSLNKIWVEPEDMPLYME